ncbi:hypothetical protein FRC03_001412 [Tulasnella sp. 419]|nr:hypothetical protein FRC03_001412 [Tulasnella sp. 419]
MPYETEFTWPWPASSVILTGSFDNWSRSVNLTKTGNGFSGKVPLPYGSKVSFKFIVDGNWATHAYFPTERDSLGNLNNILYTPVEPPKKPEPVSAPVPKAPEVPVEQPKVVPEPKQETPHVPAFDVDPRISRSFIESLAEVIQTTKAEEPAEPLKQIADEAPTLTEVISNAASTAVGAITSVIPGLEHKVETTVSPSKEAPSEVLPASIVEPVQEVKQKVEEIPEIPAAEEKVAEVTGPVADTLKEVVGDSKEEKIPAPEEIPTVDLGDEEHVAPKSEAKPTETVGQKPELSPSPSAAGPAVVEVPKTPTQNVGEPVVTTAAPTIPAAPVTPSKPTHKSNNSSVSAPVTPATLGRSSSVFTSGTSDTNATPTSKRNKWMNKKDSSDSGSPMKSLKEEGHTPGKKKRHSFIQKIKDVFK